MTPRLLLLTGPAAGEVAAVLRYESGQDDEMLPCPIREWDEVRDYGAEPISAYMRAHPRCGHGVRVPTWLLDEAIRSLPGGEAWLVGLVLPEPHGMINHWSTPMPVYGRRDLTDDHVAMLLRVRGLPARLAILAPEPPPLLVERVRAWGGEVWDCDLTSPGDRPCGISDPATSTWRGMGDTWPEAVRDALGEVAPC